MKSRCKNLNSGFGLGVFLLLAGLFAYGIGTANAGSMKSGSGEASFTVLAKGKAKFFDAQGEEKGEAILQESVNGVLITLKLHDMPAGLHAIHIHGKGVCTPTGKTEGADPKDYFSNAGGHFNPTDKEHGHLNKNGPHAGDLQNINVYKNGALETYLFNDRVTLKKDNERSVALLLDDDGAAFIIHDGTDDYQTPPSGDAGKRIACAVIEAG